MKIKEKLINKGMTLSSWCRVNGFNRSLVRQLLSGKSKGFRGKSLEIRLAIEKEFNQEE